MGQSANIPPAGHSLEIHSKQAQSEQKEATEGSSVGDSAAAWEHIKNARAEQLTRREKQLQKRKEEAVWVDKAKAGDQDAFRHLVESNQGRLFALAVGMLRNRDAAMDAVQDTFIKAYRKLDAFEGNSAFSTWIYRICVNLCIDVKRAQARRKTGSLEEVGDVEASGGGIYGTVGVIPTSTGSDPSANAENRELGAQLDIAMSELSNDHRAVLLLREIEGMSYDEISETLDIPRGTVMSRLFHARRKMQEILKPYMEGERLENA